MQPHVHYDPHKVAKFMAEKATIRMMFAIAASHHLHIEHFDITGATCTKSTPNTQPVYVWQPTRFDGSYKHQHKSSRTEGKYLRNPPAACLYSTNLHKNTLKSTATTNCNLSPPCSRNTQTKEITIAVSMDDFLAAATCKEIKDELHAALKNTLSNG